MLSSSGKCKLWHSQSGFKVLPAFRSTSLHDEMVGDTNCTNQHLRNTSLRKMMAVTHCANRCLDRVSLHDEKEGVAHCANQNLRTSRQEKLDGKILIFEIKSKIKHRPIKWLALVNVKHNDHHPMLPASIFRLTERSGTGMISANNRDNRKTGIFLNSAQTGTPATGWTTSTDQMT